MTGFTPKDKCEFCGCTPARPCSLQAGEECCWIDQRRTVCSNPSCARQDMTRKRRSPRGGRMSSADVHRVIRARGRGKRDRTTAIAKGLLRPNGGAA